MKKTRLFALLVFAAIGCARPNVESTNDAVMDQAGSTSSSEIEATNKLYAIFVVKYQFCQLAEDFSQQSNECKQWAEKVVHSDIIEITGWNEEKIYRQKDELLLEAKRGSVLGFKLKSTEIQRFTSYREASDYLEQNL